MKANRVLTVVFSSAFIILSAAFLPAPNAQVVRAEEDTTIESAVDTQKENKEDEPELSEEEQAAKEAEAKRKALQNDPTHIHHFKWVAIMNESESAEGTINYMCPECGKIWYFRPISAYYAFQGDVARRIETAPENATVKVKTSVFINFNKQVMQALEERPDVSLYVSFLDGEYKGNRVSFVIPAGEDTVSLLDENGYAGFLFLGGKYGLTMEVPVVVEAAKETDSEEAATSTEEKIESTDAQ
ncbi:hypothetical protein [Butyrivibrio sp. FCS006]|uniref:hypothetical protein n=1 Tax=Butyrivibrio sp. FCS006 TaxID=1280684 RepID=UPI000402B203|nr:hypothetical protein [Butyrivibrio sp. FCS006]